MLEFSSHFDMIEEFEAHTVLSGNAPLTATRRNRDMAGETVPDECWDIYRLICAETGKSYIGLTKSGHAMRWYHHVRNATKLQKRSLLYSAIRKHGHEAFTVEVLYQATSVREAVAVERGLIAQYGTMNPGGYNLTSGGETHPGFYAQKRTVSEEHLARLRRNAAAMRGKPRDRESVEKGRLKQIGKPGNMLGRKHSPETIEKMRIVQQAAALVRPSTKGIKKSPEGAARIAAGVRAALQKNGHGYTKGRKNPKTSETLKKIWADPVFREKMLASRKRRRTAKVK